MANKPCEIIFTSGTWSEPKGVVLSQQNLLANVEQILSVYPYSKPTVVLGILPLSHAYQQTLGLLVPLALGSKVVFLKVTNSLDLINAIKSQNVDLIPMIPRVFELLRSAILRKIRNVYLRKVFTKLVNWSYYLPITIRRNIFYFIHQQLGSSLRVLIAGGSPFDRNLDRFFQGLGYHVFVGYGLSECSPIVTAGFSSERKQGEVGKPLPGITVDLNHLNEVVVQGENVFLGYWPHIENKVSILNTGDIGEITNSGTLILKGRSKNLIIFDNGEKCFCEDLERIINSHDGIESSCVVERRVSGEVRAECLVVLSENRKIDTARIINYVNVKLPLGIKLSRVVFVQNEDFPRTHTLKPNRAKVLSLLDSE
jgi:long-chain acyl-CoA synthetase